MAELRIKEIYRSIQGESSFAGWPCTFIRTAGCDLRCRYCDEAHAFHGGTRLDVETICQRVRAEGVELVELTGGEPLLQAALPELIGALLGDGRRVLIETGGHKDISILDPRVHVILDLKTPSSGMEAHNDYGNLERLNERAEVKVVIGDAQDYKWAADLIGRYELDRRVPVHFSPVHGELDPRSLSSWILADGLRVRLNLQLHKYIWGPDAKQV